MSTAKKDKSSWAIGGTTIIGVGVGLIYVQTAPLVLIASVLIGLGVGLVLVPIISNLKERDLD